MRNFAFGVLVLLLFAIAVAVFLLAPHGSP
jgi:cbb3-type cytochrome oxidase subunit 3